MEDFVNNKPNICTATVSEVEGGLVLLQYAIRKGESGTLAFNIESECIGVVGAANNFYTYCQAYHTPKKKELEKLCKTRHPLMLEKIALKYNISFASNIVRMCDAYGFKDNDFNGSESASSLSNQTENSRKKVKKEVKKKKLKKKKVKRVDFDFGKWMEKKKKKKKKKKI